jgi:putative ABC transport system permease protein
MDFLMSLLARLASGVRNLFRTERVDRDLDDEMRSYVDLVADEKLGERLTPEAARRAALIETGGVEQVKEEVRDVRAGAAIDVLRRDVRFGVRSLIKTPAFTVAATIALALGIGATTAILSVVNGVLLRPLPYADGDRLVVILHNGRNPVAPGNVIDWRQQTHSFTDIAAAEYWSANLTGTDQPENVLGLRMSAGMFPLLGVQPLSGRVFAQGEDIAGNDRVAVITYGLWQRRFGGDRGIVGREVSFDGNPYTIIGVMPQSFQFAPFWATHAEVFVALPLNASAGNRGGQSLRAFARLRPGVTLQQAQADLAAVTARLEQQFPGTNRNVTVQSLKHKVVGDIQMPLLVLLVAVAFVLLIACANVAHMLLARAAFRQKELAIRTALGATQRRIVAQLLVESVLLALAGGVAGLLLAVWGVRALIAASPAIIPRVASVTIDGRVLLMTLLITAITSIVFGLMPALRAARVDLVDSFKDGDRGATEGQRKSRLRSALVASEFALALVLLVGAGLMIRSFSALRSFDPGFDPRNVVTMTISVAGTKLDVPAARPAFFNDALARIRAIPGVESAGYINHLPIAGDQWGFPFVVEGQPKPKSGDAPTAAYRVVVPGYFRAMRIPVLRGRDISDADRVDAPSVVVINEFMAKKHWPGEDAVGKRISLDDSTWITVVGVTKNTVREQWAAPAEEEMFLPFAQSRSFFTSRATRFAYLTLVARASCDGRATCDAASLAAPIANAVRTIDRNVAISAVQTMTSVVASATAESRFYVVLLGTFAGIALSLAAVGIYGVMSYSVSRRTHEIGIRIALGAEPSSVLRLVVAQGARLAAIGAGVGVIAAFGLTRMMSKLLYGVAPSDPATFVVVTLVLCAVAVVASYLPARRATRIDPLSALRSD